MSRIQVAVGSTKQQKCQAVERIFSSISQGASPILVSINAHSGINEQPVGLDETLKGACNRLTAARKAHPNSEFAVGIENGIVKTVHEAQVHWIDFAWVAIDHISGRRAIASSTGVEFPLDLVQEAERRGFNKVTVGSLIAEKYRCDSSDPHSFLTNQSVSRVDMLVQAGETALGQLLRQLQ